MPETKPSVSLAGQSLAAIAKAIEERGSAPVDQWNPTHCGDSEMKILRDGTWLHQGSPITRPAMVRLLSTVLRREEDGSHVLVTPVEKLTIEVERTAFRAIAMTMEGAGEDRRIAFELDSGDAVIAGPDHAISVIEEEDGPSPRVHVRHGLEAEIARPLYYKLAETALAEEAKGVWSDGVFFSLEP
ncbi:DUF1285 domain-containing protein [Sphingomicrobium clamense]|uniref:DUF1285 domain-containing protein n=1 Tax=Sphingomicrobium clamense TaxID=2851013 RepID=A0ABS6V787_9SPHN|nr:DUF1285 domain-containing protein [Sphingomicrobium sp. B8]MBW0145440.1 DUF1285 domain-containing protein [Sphingomicrobium sp. B8]